MSKKAKSRRCTEHAWLLDDSANGFRFWHWIAVSLGNI
jgi:hypothetical protein